MSTKIDEKNLNSGGDAKNDWDLSDEDDNWEDWGDAEDNFSEIIKVEKDPSAAKKTEKNSINNNENNIDLSPKKHLEKQQNEKTSLKTEQQQPLQQLQQQAQENKSSTWGGIWGGKLSSVLTTATEGLGNITSTVNQGFNQMIGVPDPEEMARMNTTQQSDEQKQQLSSSQQTTTAAPAFGLSLVSGVTTLGTKVLNSGLDTLEGIGKKTMTILTENDPKLLNKRKILGLEAEKPNLSAILQEAKNDADQLEHTLREMQIEKSRAQLRFEILFENNCGLVHFEALEILSKESNLKLQTLVDSVSGNALIELQETINEVRELLELDDLECESEGDYDAEQLNVRFQNAIQDIHLPLQFDDVISNWSQSLEWLSSVAAKESDVEEAFAKAITALSETCALEMCKLHKIGELLLVKEHHSTANEVDSIVQLCKEFSSHLHGLTNRYASLLNGKGDTAKARVNTLFAEMLIAVQYIEKSYHLFVPILQIGAV